MFKTVGPALSIILALLVGFFYVKPTYDDIGLVQDEIAEYQEALSKASEFNQQLTQLTQRRSSLTASQIDKLEAVAPDSVNVVKLIVDLEAAATAQGLLFGNIVVNEDKRVINRALDKDADTLGSAITDTDFSTVELGFGVIGTYGQFRDFLATVESSLTLVDVKSVSMTVTEGELQQYSLIVTRQALKPLEI